MPVPQQNQYRVPMPVESTTAKGSAPADIQYRDIAYVYPRSMQLSAMGDQYEEWEEVPIPVRCSFQEHALDSENINPNNQGSRFARIYTREPSAFKWHDKIVVRNITMLCTKILVHYDNFDGKMHHAEIRGVFLGAPLEDPRA